MVDSRNRSSSVERAVPLVAVLALGFAGGVLANVIFPSMARLPQLPGDHPLLGAPFLTFLSIILVIAVFYSPLKTLLSKGALTIKWGDREISITEIEANVDTQFNELESKLANMADEIEGLKKSARDIAPTPQEPRRADDGTVAQIRHVFNEVKSNDLASVIFHLGTSSYKWRNQATLSKRTGLEPEDIDAFALSVPDLIVRSTAKSGAIIYRLTTEAKARFLMVTQKTAV